MKNDNHDIDTPSRDERLGAALARALAESGASGDCPGDEDLAALLERSLPADRLESLQAHIAGCDDCLARYTVAARLHLPKADSARRGWLGYAAGLAAVAAGLTAVILTRQQPSAPIAQSAPATIAERGAPGGPQAGDTKERSLQASAAPAQSSETPLKLSDRSKASASTATAVALAEIAWDGAEKGAVSPASPGKSYGFAGSVSPGKSAFRVGVATMDLGAALKGGDAAARSAAVERLGELLGTDAATAEIRELLREDAPADVRRRYLLLVEHVERHAGQSGQALTFRFGAWSETGRLAGAGALLKVVDRASIRTFREGLHGDDLPEGARRSLERLDASLSSASASGNDPRRIRHILGDIVEMY